jgi:hypothetical protein
MCRTTDSELRQQLAIKVLAEAFFRHPERLARFALPVSGFAPLAIFNPSGCDLQSSLARFISINYVAERPLTKTLARDDDVVSYRCQTNLTRSPRS